jgi:hypothetical protein
MPQMPRRRAVSSMHAAHRKVPARRRYMRRTCGLACFARRAISLSDLGKACGRLLLATAFLIGLTPALSWACACGCGIYEVGTPSLFPTGGGGTVWLEYDFQDQYLNWHATQIASAQKNDDKVIRTNFMTLGAQYMFNRQWGVMLEVPYWQRYFKTTTDSGQIDGFNFDSIGDIRIEGMYTGLSEDMSTGLLAGVKVPSGWWTYPNADRDTQIGTGSTDLLLGAYHQGTVPSELGDVPLTFMGRPFNWFAQVYYDLPLWEQDQYTPGRELDGGLGTYYNFGTVGPLEELAPMVTLLASDRTRDTGANASPGDTGYTRLLIAPGAEIKLGSVRLYGDVEVPFFQNMRGNQLIAPVLFKTILSYDF